MRFGLVSLMIAGLLVQASAAVAHPEDEFPQVTLKIEISDQSVELSVAVPAKAATLTVFDGLTPVAMDRMEPEDLAKLIEPVFAQRCPVMIDGVLVGPTVIDPVVSMRNSRQPARRFPEAQTFEQGTLHFIARYETKGPPRRVSIDWSIYANQYDDAGEPIHADDILMIAALVAADQQEQFIFLSPAEPSYTWHAEEAFVLTPEMLTAQPLQRHSTSLPAPFIVSLLFGAVAALGLHLQKRSGVKRTLIISFVVGLISLPFGQVRIELAPSDKPLEDEQALVVFELLHRNIYRAFDYTDEGAVYDALAQSVDGPMLETIYNDVYQSLIMREENGAVSKVVRVEVDRASLQPLDELDEAAHGSSAYKVYCAWQVDGLVTHFGHSHARTNAFTAVYIVAPRAEGWRIAESTIIDQQRIDDGSQTAEDLLKS